MVEHSPSRFESIQFAMVIDLLSSDLSQNGREWRVVSPKNGYKTGGEGGVCLQYDASTQGHFLHKMVAKNHSAPALRYPIL